MTTSPTQLRPDLKGSIAARLAAVRERTLLLVRGLSEDALNRVHDALMSPIVWDLGHIATFEDLWLAQRAFGRRPLREGVAEIYDALTAPRSERGGLPYLRSSECLTYMEAVRERALECLEQADLEHAESELLAGGFVYEMIIRHEQQHSETILQTLQLMTAEPYAPPREAHVPAAAERDGQMALVPGGPFEMGAGALSAEGFSYDNERPPHEVRLEPFLIDTTPVTNGDVIAFVEEGGYGRREWWSDEGWAWRERESVSLPLYWQREGAGFVVRSFDEVQPVDPAHPACHVSWHEADAFARFAGKRLPTEAEWEKAAAHDHVSGKEHRYPWGDDPPTPDRANLDQLAFGTAPAGAYLEGASAAGARQLLGDVWEWTASGFERYAGFKAFPYREYSEEFFGGPFRVLRGGSWATQAGAVTNTFRNWDYPERRQIFAGFRCAKDADA